MLEISPVAAEQLQAALTEASEAEGACVRIAVTESGVQLLIDEQRDGDTALEHEDKVLVVMDSLAAQVLDDRKIDYDQATSQFVFA